MRRCILLWQAADHRRTLFCYIQATSTFILMMKTCFLILFGMPASRRVILEDECCQKKVGWSWRKVEGLYPTSPVLAISFVFKNNNTKITCYLKTTTFYEENHALWAPWLVGQMDKADKFWRSALSKKVAKKSKIWLVAMSLAEKLGVF